MNNYLKKWWSAFDRANRMKAITALTWETSELEHIFALLTVGIFVGMPSPPIQISLDLLPDLEDELVLLLNKVAVAQGPISDLFSILDVS